MSDPPEIRRYDRSRDRLQIEAFVCARRRRPWARDAQDILRASPGAVDDGEALEILVAVDSIGAVVGVAVFSPDPSRPDVYWSRSIGVCVPRQREGIGMRLKQAVAAEVASRNPMVRADLLSEVHRKNQEMNGLNRKLGCTSDTRDKHYLTIMPIEAVD
jgi:L-amino acid N-acyltransferase YncA